MNWAEIIKEEQSKEYFKKLKKFLKHEWEYCVVFPEKKNIYNAFKYTPFDKIKVVIIGQDPYIKEGQAHGLAFSVPEGINRPPTLINIIKEVMDDLNYRYSNIKDLTSWAQQGVLLLNSVLTVRAGESGSHANKGWEKFTDAIIEKISWHHTGIVFILWGQYAQKKGIIIDEKKHFILKGAHPSPYSAYRGFYGGKYFSIANEILEEQFQKPIQWEIQDD